jgi:hypothetical protein
MTRFILNNPKLVSDLVVKDNGVFVLNHTTATKLFVEVTAHVCNVSPTTAASVRKATFIRWGDEAYTLPTDEAIKYHLYAIDWNIRYDQVYCRQFFFSLIYCQLFTYLLFISHPS